MCGIHWKKLYTSIDFLSMKYFEMLSNISYAVCVYYINPLPNIEADIRTPDLYILNNLKQSA